MPTQNLKNDTKLDLNKIRDQRSKSVVEQLLKIQEFKYQDKKSFEWVKNLDCLTLSHKRGKWRRLPNGQWIYHSTKFLQRISIPGHKRNLQFVAVSYRWGSGTNSTFSEYRVESRHGTNSIPSMVSSEVYDRVDAYTRYHGMDGFWIDQEAIDQNNAERRDIAMQSMDLVYNNSAISVGLIRERIETQEELTLLQRLIGGEFISTSRSGHSKLPRLEKSLKTCTKALRILDRITSDKWWSRGWIYQEEYRSSLNMNLLIRCSIELDDNEKRDFGYLAGELQIKSVKFREQTTLFCLAYGAKKGYEWSSGQAICRKVLKRAQKYTILCLHSNRFGDRQRMKAMSPAIFTEIGDRNITNKEDILPIAANCCGYPIRLSTKKLKKTQCSISISILALYLLNGEILKNDKDDKGLLSMPIFEFLKHQSLDSFNPPIDSKELSFMKGCRFGDVQLSRSGIETSGLLWKLGRKIDTREIARKYPTHLDLPNGYRSKKKLSRRQTLVLKELVKLLHGHHVLIQDVETFLEDDRKEKEFQSTRYKYLMAKELIWAIQNGETLRLGLLANNGRVSSPYRAIFISDDKVPGASHVFTSWNIGRPEEDTRALRDIEKYVSIEVTLDGRDTQNLQRLRTKRWINGLCFFHGCSPKEVVFPWPAAMTM